MSQDQNVTEEVTLWRVTTKNPERRMVINAKTKELAEKEFKAMRESAGLTEESEIVSFEKL